MLASSQFSCRVRPFGAYMNPDQVSPGTSKNIPYPAPARQKTSVLPYRKIKTGGTQRHGSIEHIIHLPGGQRIIAYSNDGSFRVWDLERGTQVGEEWEDKETRVNATALSPDGKTVASGSWDGAVRLWNIDTGKVVKTWTGHTGSVHSVCWSPDGGRVVSKSLDETFRVWDVESGRTIIGPINAGKSEVLPLVCYSPDGKMIVTIVDVSGLKVWDANTGKLLRTFEGSSSYGCLIWTSIDEKTLLFSVRATRTKRFDTATWTETVVLEYNLHKLIKDEPLRDITGISLVLLPPNNRILVGVSYNDTAQLWNLETDRPIGTPLYHEDSVNCASFSADGKFFVTGCEDGHIYIWNISAIVEKADLLSDNVDTKPRPPPKIKSSRRLPPGFFDDARNLSSTHTDCHTSTPYQRTLGRFSSFWRHSKPHRATGHDTQPRSRPLSWPRNLASGIPIVEVPCTAGKPRNYHARKKSATSSSRPIPHNAQQPSGAAQNTPSSSQQPPLTATASTVSVVAGTAGAKGTISRPQITIDSGWRARFMVWVCCMPIQNTDGQH